MTEPRLTGTALLTGATGRLGTEVVHAAVERGLPICALVRPTSDVATLRALDVPVVTGDLTRPGTLTPAVEGADVVLLLTGDSPTQARLERALVTAAVRAGVPRAVKVSAHSAGLDPPVGFGRAHRESEDALRASGLAWSVLRPTFFMQSLLLLADAVRRGVLVLPTGRGRVAMVDRRDVADAVVVALADARHDGRVHTLTGPAAPTLAEVARVLSAVRGRRVRHVSPPRAVARALLPMSAGLSRWEARMAVDLFDALRQDAQATVTGDVARLTGRPPRGLATFVSEAATAFGVPAAAAR